MVVEVAEHRGGEPRQTLGPIDEWMVVHQRVEESSGLEDDGRIGLFAEGARSRSVECGVEEPEVAHRADAESSDHRHGVIEVQELHLAHALPSRSSTSPHRSTIRSIERSTCVAWVERA